MLHPACGSGNFLYVTLEHLKRLEAEVLNQLREFGAMSEVMAEGETVTLRQLLGIELNSRAAAVAELVLWIGWLQWHVRTQGLASVAEPVVHDYGNIENRDAVLAYDGVEPAVDASGKVITRWDGKTFKTHPVTGEQVPDEAAQVLRYSYVNPRPAEWPAADFIVGNPPFIGKLKLREALGDGYVRTLRDAWPQVPDSADFVMYWWHHAAQLVRSGAVERFGVITTNSIRQTFNRRVVELHLAAPKDALRLSFAVPDHPWVDSADGAAVRIAMTVAQLGENEPRLLTVIEETESDDDEVKVVLAERRGLLHADLRVGANVAGAKVLRAMRGVTSMGAMLAGSGFIVDASVAASLREQLNEVDASKLIRSYRNGRDLTDRPRDVYVIDTFGWSLAELRGQAPSVYQHLVNHVKPERDANRDKAFRERWWLHGRARAEMRIAQADLTRYIATVETSKHRMFQFLGAEILPDHRLIAIAVDDALVLGLLSSMVHLTWALAAGGTLEDRPVYNKSLCFDPFPFPHEDTGLTPALTTRIRELAEQLDAHRKARQAAHDTVTLTGMYNVLDKLRRAEPLNAKDKLLHEQALVSVLQSLHDDLDAAVLQAYGWADLGPVPWADDAAHAAWTDAVLERLVALNARRAAEEAAGTVRWLRPDFQDPARRAAAPPLPQQQGIDGVETQAEAAASSPDAEAEAEASGIGNDARADTPAAAPASAPAAVQAWPAGLPDQVRSVAQLLSASPAPLPLAAIEASFKGKGPWKKGLPRILDTLEALGRARQESGGWRG